MRRSCILFSSLVILTGAGLLEAQPFEWWDFAFSPLTDKSLAIDDINWNSMCRVMDDSSNLWVVGMNGEVRNYKLEDSLDLEDAVLLVSSSLGSQYALNDVFFWDAVRGWIVGCVDDSSGDNGKGVLWRTVNGGADWIPMPEWDFPHHIIQNKVPFLRVEFFSRYDGFIRCVDDYLLKTNDGGITWMEISKEP